MLSVCLIFLYVLLVAYSVGFLVLTGIRRFGVGRNREDGEESFWKEMKADSYCMAGLLVLTVYAQFFSLFYKVGLAANLLLLAICAVTVVVLRKELYERLFAVKGKWTLGTIAFSLFLFLLFAYGTSRGIIHYDTGLYHGQSIRWIEEYGVVKGLGNLHCRLAYNSSAFSLSALFSFSFLGIQSYHCMAGLFALLLAKVCAEIAYAWKRGRLILSDFARIACIYYLLIIYDEMVSPASDYFMVLTIFYIVIRYLDLLEREEESWVPYGLLCLLGVYAMSLKLSAALILLLVIKPAVILIRRKNLGAILSFIGLGALIITPYLIRNVIISGWLVYPFTAVDFFDVDWKIPKGIADYDSKEIQVWGRGIYDVTRFEEPLGRWLPEWLKGLGMIDKLSVLIAAVSVIALVFAAIFIIGKRQKDKYDWLLVAVTVDLSFLFWLLSAPLIRYGCVYVWLASVVTLGGIALYTIRSRTLWKAIYTLLCLAACYKLFAFGSEIAMAYDGNNFVMQKDYEDFETVAYEVDGVIIYYPVQGDRVGYAAFPSSPAVADVMLRKEEIQEGFRYREK